MSRKRYEEPMTFDNIELEPIRKNEITGVVLQPGITDLQNQVIDAQEVEEAYRIWNAAFEHLTIQHRDKTGALIDLESLSDPKTFDACFDDSFEILSSFCVDSPCVLNGENIAGGSWLLSLRVENPEIWELIRSGRLSGYSIGALGIKTPNGVTKISSLLVPEISLVGKPANQRNFLIIKQLENIKEQE